MKSLELLPIRTPEAARRSPSPETAEDVTRIIAAVRRDGDRALSTYAAAFGDPPPRRVEREEFEDALDRLPFDLREALKRMHGRVARFALAQREALAAFSYESDGLRMGQRLVPVASAGAYVPAGRYPLPSSAVMTVTPAKAAGVERTIVCTPRATDAMLAACAIAGADEVYEVGGAQAIAAMAFGTGLISKVDTVAGPGNTFVSEAKRQLFGVCGIDLIAGPSEVAVIASGDADAASVAHSLLAEAEHDPDARAYLISDDAALIERVQAGLPGLLDALSTASIARSALARSAAVLCGSLRECAEAADALSIEHLELHGPRAAGLRDEVRSYGALFIDLPAAFGDYGAGPNHTLPTGGAARYASGLSAYAFLRVRPFLERASALADALRADCEQLAEAEGLPGHQAAIQGVTSAG